LLAPRYKMKPIAKVSDQFDQVRAIQAPPSSLKSRGLGWFTEAYFSIDHYNDFNYVPVLMPGEELRHGFRNSAAQLYSDELTGSRRETFSRKFLWPLIDTTPAPEGNGP
jgi:hypothetical protein